MEGREGSAPASLASLHDHFWLYQQPELPDAIHWSQDNHLAVAAGHTVVILNPSHLAGPRGYVAIPQADYTGSLCAGCRPADPESCLHALLAAG